MLLIFAGIMAGGALFVVLLFAIYQLANSRRSAPRWSYALLAFTILGAMAMLSRWSGALPFEARHGVLLGLTALATFNTGVMLLREKGLTAKLTGVVVAGILLLIWHTFPAWQSAGDGA